MNSQFGTGMESPWLSMVCSPRRTIHAIILANPKRNLSLVASLVGVATMLRELQSIHAGDRLILSLLLVIALAGGAVLGIVLNNWLGWLLHSVSSRLGGHGTVDGVRAAYAWSFVPNVWALVLWIPAIAVFGRGLFTSSVPTPQASAVRSIAYLSFLIIQFIAGAWSLVLLIASVSEVEAMSVWRTIAAMLLAILIISVTLFLIAALMQGLHFVPTSTSG